MPLPKQTQKEKQKSKTDTQPKSKEHDEALEQAALRGCEISTPGDIKISAG